MNTGSEPEPPLVAEGGFLEFPEDWDELSEGERLAVALGMALELQSRLGITPKDDGLVDGP